MYAAGITGRTGRERRRVRAGRRRHREGIVATLTIDCDRFGRAERDDRQRGHRDSTGIGRGRREVDRVSDRRSPSSQRAVRDESVPGRRIAADDRDARQAGRVRQRRVVDVKYVVARQAGEDQCRLVRELNRFISVDRHESVDPWRNHAIGVVEDVRAIRAIDSERRGHDQVEHRFEIQKVDRHQRRGTGGVLQPAFGRRWAGRVDHVRQRCGWRAADDQQVRVRTAIHCDRHTDHVGHADVDGHGIVAAERVDPEPA